MKSSPRSVRAGWEKFTARGTPGWTATSPSKFCRRNSLPMRNAASDSYANIPTWRRYGKGLYYLGAEGKLMEVAVTPKGSAVEVGIPHEILRARFVFLSTYARSYDVAPDGKRFLVLSAEDTSATPLTLVTNWPRV